MAGDALCRKEFEESALVAEVVEKLMQEVGKATFVLPSNQSLRKWIDFDIDNIPPS